MNYFALNGNVWVEVGNRFFSLCVCVVFFLLISDEKK